MGYTHYWYKNYDAGVDVFMAKYAELLPIVRKIVENGSVKLCEIICDGCIHINGIDDDGHETFVWLPGKSVDDIDMLMNLHANPTAKFSQGLFAFCKTDRKDYDKVVVACLCAIQYIYGDNLVHVSSNGDMQGEEWADGRALFARVMDIMNAEVQNEVHNKP